jgi:hypothetical protein
MRNTSAKLRVVCTRDAKDVLGTTDGAGEREETGIIVVVNEPLGVDGEERARNGFGPRLDALDSRVHRDDADWVEAGVCGGGDLRTSGGAEERGEHVDVEV